MAKKSETTLINEERDRLMKVFKDLPADKLAVVDGLIDQAAFMRITLDRLQESIKDSDLVESYQNGEAQSGFKQAAELQAYNALIKNYSTVIRQLVQAVPKQVSKKQPNQLLQILEARQEAKQKAAGR